MTAHPAASGARPSAYLLDLDGVLRVWDPGDVTAIEVRHGLPAGRLAEVAYAPARYGPAVLGEISDEQWRSAVVSALLPECGADAAIEAVVDWSARLGRVDPEVAGLLSDVRAAGGQVALVVNATTRLELDLVVLGLTESVDAVVNSARTGIAKPDAAMYTIAAGILAVPVELCVYVGTRPEHVAGAERTGMAGHLYDGPAGLRAMVESRTAP